MRNAVLNFLRRVSRWRRGPAVIVVRSNEPSPDADLKFPTEFAKWLSDVYRS